MHRELPPPDPYHYDKRDDAWTVHRMVYEPNENPASNAICVNVEVDSIHESPYEAISRCYKLNGESLAIHPLDALLHLFVEASAGSHSGARTCAAVLLGLYNGSRFPFDLTDLRLLDRLNKQAAMVAIDFDSPCKMEVHSWLDLITNRSDMGNRFEHLAYKFRLTDSAPEGENPPPLTLISPLVES